MYSLRQLSGLATLYECQHFRTGPDCCPDICFILCHTCHQRYNRGKNSKALLSFQFVESKFIYLVAYITGTRPASIGDGRFTVITPGENRYDFPLKVSGQTKGDAFIPAGDSKQIKLYIRDTSVINGSTRLSDYLEPIGCLLNVEIIHLNRQKDKIELFGKCTEYQIFIQDQLLMTYAH